MGQPYATRSVGQRAGPGYVWGLPPNLLPGASIESDCCRAEHRIKFVRADKAGSRRVSFRFQQQEGPTRAVV
jgi:hypothetical protein